MSRITKPPVLDDFTYPTGDGKPMAETEWHRDLMISLIQTLAMFFAPSPRVCVSGNLLVYYAQGDRRRHVSPDVFVVRGVRRRRRVHYLVWDEGKSPEFVIELTSSSTRREDLGRKFRLYRDTLRVKEYFLFDPLLDYLDPPLQGFRLRKGQYRPIRAVNGRLPSRVTGLHLEQDRDQLRLWDPRTALWLPTPQERVEQAEAKVEQLRREIEELRRRNGR